VLKFQRLGVAISGSDKALSSLLSKNRVWYDIATFSIPHRVFAIMLGFIWASAPDSGYLLFTSILAMLLNHCLDKPSEPATISY